MKMVPGIYVSRVDEVGGDYVTTFDIRIKRPNAEPEIAPAAMHTIEHLVATFLRNDSKWKDRLVYWGPMGCLTGCYMITKGRPRPEDIYPIILKAFEFVRDFEGEIPGASPEKWQLEACDFTMSRFSGLYGAQYKGMITNSKEAKEKASSVI